MCKIYPPLPFNKFVVFILYCLLSITLAQIYNCEVTPPKRNNYTVVGYVQYNTNPSSISWNLYDYINVIVNDQNPPKDPKTKEPIKEPFKKFFEIRDALKAKSKIFLAMRPKDPLTLKQLTDDTRSDEDITNIVNLVNNNKLDGIDIEYPGKRGALCNRENCNDDGCVIWAKGDEPKFVTFLISLQARLNGKPIMLTVGEHEAVTGLHNVIDFINIEAYHHSIYDNVKNPPPVLPAVPTPGDAQPDPLIRFRTTSNGPLNKFREIYNSYLTSYRTSKVKIIMGIDFGNTLQIVTNPEIVDNLSIEFSYDLNDTNEKTIIGQIQDKEIVKIEPFCKNPVNTPPPLYLWPWKSLSVSSNYCDSRPGWNHKFDTDNTFTPWLTKKVDDDKYYFVSYEDITSISHKLKFIDEVGAEGISISDISYDDKNILLNFIRNNPQSDAPPNPATPPGKPESSTSSTINSQGTNNNLNKGGPNKVGAIVGSIFGVLAVVALAAASFILWRRKNQLPIFTNKELPGIHTTPKEYNEMTTEPNRFNTPTTVLPVSSTGYVTAMFDFEGKEANDLSFRKGDKIEVLERGDGPNDWWVGRVNGAIGEFPGNYVKETGL